MLASWQDVARYRDDVRRLPRADVEDALLEAGDWVVSKVSLNGHVPLPVSEATALLAACLLDEPDSVPITDTQVPNMVRLMLASSG